MFDQLDEEMRARRIDTILAIGDTALGNPELAYVAGTTLPLGGIFLKRINQQPTLVVSNIDLGNARNGRVRRIHTYADYQYDGLVKRYGRERGYVMLVDALLRSVRARGTVVMYGRTESSRLLSLSDSLRKVGHKIKGDRDALLIECLRATKDPGEIRKIRAIGQQAAEVIENVLEMLRECRVVSRKLKLAKRNLTVGRAKSMINTLLAERGLITSEGTIFAVGARSADPHYAGRSSDTVRARTPIMIDLFPMHGDGYWFDLTRTCVIGRAPKKVRAMHDAVLEVQLRALDSMKDGVMGRDLMNSACDLFERRGFITLRSALKANKPAGNVGFIHSLGHGVGLRVSERPYLGLLSDDRLRDGNVVTVEPGLYAPGVGGVRIEDTVLVRRGQVDNLTPLEKELEI